MRHIKARHLMLVLFGGIFPAITVVTWQITGQAARLVDGAISLLLGLVAYAVCRAVAWLYPVTLDAAGQPITGKDADEYAKLRAGMCVHQREDHDRRKAELNR